MNPATLQATPNPRPSVSVECSDRPLPLHSRLRAILISLRALFTRRNVVAL